MLRGQERLSFSNLHKWNAFPATTCLEVKSIQASSELCLTSTFTLRLNLWPDLSNGWIKRIHFSLQQQHCTQLTLFEVDVMCNRYLPNLRQWPWYNAKDTASNWRLTFYCSWYYFSFSISNVVFVLRCCIVLGTVCMLLLAMWLGVCSSGWKQERNDHHKT